MSDVLWHLSDFVAALEGAVVGEPLADVTGISIDSRTVAPGEAFFCIAGGRFDGHDYAEKAIGNGAALAVVSKERVKNLSQNGPYVVVEDVLQALERLGRAARQRTKAKIVAVTGSVGKTSTKEALRIALSKSGRTHASVASFNNHWGVPLTLARMPEDTEFGVFEIGMNAPGEIETLVKMVEPDFAVITTVAAVHLEFFDSVDDIAKAKAEIFAGLKPGGTAVLNADNDQIGNLLDYAKKAGVSRVVQFGSGPDAEARALSSVQHPDCTCVSARILGHDVTYKIGTPGQHLVNNSLAVLVCAELMGADLALAGLALSDVKAPKGRGERWHLNLPAGKALLIDESYNANPLSMSAAIRALGDTPITRPGRYVAVVGDMLELGDTSPALHAALAEPLANAAIDIVYCVGPQMQHLWDVLPREQRGRYATQSSELDKILAEEIRPGDIVMIKGSLGSRMGPLVEQLKQKFSKTSDMAEV
ncbi:MAG: UDP-N-acetylmuramoylalanyl-D-glutamyl-2,6-diaminopimelate--D-alanyl-D-alanine ligase [Stappiaceae bacterium]